MSTSMRLVIVSNRLPITAAQTNDKLLFERSVGGLASGLSSYLGSVKGDLDYIWVGWPGSGIDPSKRLDLKTIAAAKYKACPVFLSQEDLNTGWVKCKPLTVSSKWTLSQWESNSKNFKKAPLKRKSKSEKKSSETGL